MLDRRYRAPTVGHGILTMKKNLKAHLKHLNSRLAAERVFEAAAAIAFFALFSLFPLLLVTASVTSFFISGDEARQTITETISAVAPGVSSALISRNLSQVLKHQETIGLLGALVLLWTATTAFALLGRNLSRAWPRVPTRNSLGARIMATALVGAVLLLMPLFSLAQLAVAVLQSTVAWVPLIGGLVSALLSRLAIPAFVLLMFLLLFRFVPKAPVSWKQAATGALFAAVGTQLFTFLFSWYLSSGVSRYNVIYGSLGSVVAFLFWAYISVVVILIGAHISAFGQTRDPRGTEADQRGTEADQRGDGDQRGTEADQRGDGGIRRGSGGAGSGEAPSA